MLFEAETLDDLLADVLSALLKRPFNISASKGITSEYFGVLLKLKNPLARLSLTETKGKAFSALGELLWYLSKSNNLSFIEYYISEYKNFSDDHKTIHGGYGPRLFNMDGRYDQVETIIELLKKSPNTRRAVIQLIDAKDTVKKYLDIPCTCTLQFAIRDDVLNMFTTMRSNDAFLALPHDVFSFTMLQEIIARSIGVEIGEYYHAVGSLHLYKTHKEKAEQYLSEGYQSTKLFMPPMPQGDPWNSITRLMAIEVSIRENKLYDMEETELDSYWKDFSQLLLIHRYFKENRFDKICEVQKKITTEIYQTYIQTRLKKKNG